jgi:hypothetical protein
MAQASITINATTGSNPPNGTELVVGATVSLDNTNAGGELTYLWEFLDKPEGSLSAFSNSAIQNPTFVADSEGTYLIKLTVNRTLASEQVDTVIAGIKQVKSKIRVPAAGETQEESTARGWAEDVNRGLQVLDANQANPARLVAYANGSLSRGKVVYIDAMQTIKSGLPGEEKVPRLALAQASSTVVREQPLFVVHSKVGGGTSVSSGDLCYVTLAGVVGPLALGAGAALDPVYVDDTAAISTTAGTNARRIGHIAYVSGSDYYVYVDGSQAHSRSELTLVGNAGINKPAGDLVINVVDAILTYGDTIQLDSVAGTTVSASGTDHWRFKTDGTLESQGATRFVSNVKDPVSNQDAATKAYVDASKAGVYYCGNTDTPAAATEVCLDPGFGTRTAPASAGSYPSFVAPTALTFSNLRVKAKTGPGGAALDVTVWVNNAPTTITCQLAIAGTTASDVTHTATVTAGSLIEVRVKGAGVVTSGAVDITASLTLTG